MKTFHSLRQVSGKEIPRLLMERCLGHPSLVGIAKRAPQGHSSAVPGPGLGGGLVFGEVLEPERSLLHSFEERKASAKDVDFVLMSCSQDEALRKRSWFA